MRARSTLAGLVLIAMAATLAGCGGRSEGALTPLGPQAQAPGAHRVPVLIATTRSDQATQPGEVFGGERGRMAFADILVSVPPDGQRQPGEVQWPSNPPNTAREFAALSVDKLTQDAAQKRFHDRLARTPHRSVLVFVHGYNTRFDEAVFRLAQIAHDSRAPMLPLLFTWPSRGQVLAYGYDRESASYSRDQLEAVLNYLASDSAVNEVTILAHSMGNWVTVEALRQMAIRNKAISPKIKTVMLAAPDLDVDVFHSQIRAIGDKRPPVFVFVSRDDKALALSRRISGDAQRLGAIDLRDPQARARLEHDRIHVIDLSDQESNDRFNHNKFAGSPLVAQMIGARISAGQSLHDGAGGLGDRIGLVAVGAAGTVGRAASVVVSAPVAIVDGRTRDGLGDQLRDLGGQAGATLGGAGDIVTGR